MKRIFDVVLSVVLLLLLMPLVLIVAIAIKLDSAGSVLYRQERAGRYGKPFMMYKFRSMVSNADQMGAYYTAPGDARVTKVGKYLRKTSVDEIPQLINVLKGDMSLVGPRPDVMAQQDCYTNEEWAHRHAVRPGITGLAQATVRSEATMDQRKALDLEYVDRSTLLLDLQIILKTIVQVFFKGSH